MSWLHAPEERLSRTWDVDAKKVKTYEPILLDEWISKWCPECDAPWPCDVVMGPAWPGPCPCECNRGGFCGGCGHAGCGGRR